MLIRCDSAQGTSERFESLAHLDPKILVGGSADYFRLAQLALNTQTGELFEALEPEWETRRFLHQLVLFCCMTSTM